MRVFIAVTLSDELKKNYLQQVFLEAGMPLTDRQASAFLRYYEMLVETNRVMNLTAITEFEEVAVKHFADSCMLFSPKIREKISALGIPEEPSVIDVGTGAGFPGLPLAILCPGAKVYLLDALRKRIDFLRDVVSTLDLSNVRMEHGRAEEGMKLRESFDLTVSRAVSDLSVLSEYCLPFVRLGGFFVAYKTEDAAEEIEAAKGAIAKLGGRLVRIEKAAGAADPLSSGHTLVVVEKIAKTPKEYPRKAGTPGKDPLQ